MKRAQALQTLSSAHQHGLYVALTLERAGADSADRARSAFLHFWEREGLAHFRVEEEILLPAFASRSSADVEAVIRVLVEHVELRSRRATLAAEKEPPVFVLRELGELLEAHIRHEERVLFPLIEQTLSSDELVRLAEEIEAAEAA